MGWLRDRKDRAKNKLCCERCFTSAHVQAAIRSRKKIGQCDYCSSSDVAICKAKSLYQLLQPVFRCYRKVQDDRPRPPDLLEGLAALIDADWDLLSESMSHDSRNDLVDDIRGVYCRGTSFNRLWYKDTAHKQNAEAWTRFAERIKHHRRFDQRMDLGMPLKRVLSRISGFMPADRHVFRARLTEKTNGEWAWPIDPVQMGKPPVELCGAGGRANPPGISVLYCSDDEQTALTEIRPTLADWITVAEFRAARKLKIVDFTRVTRPDPFDQASGLTTAARFFLKDADRAFAKPVSAHESTFDYIPTQYLAEKVFSLGYDGLRFSSSLRSRGKNWVFQDDRVFRGVRSALVVATEIEVRYRRKERSSERISERYDVVGGEEEFPF